MTEHAPALRAAERVAKEKRQRLWRDYVPPNHGGDMGEFAAKVTEIVSGDTLIVQDVATNAERRVSLASLHASKARLVTAQATSTSCRSTAPRRAALAT